MPRPASERDPIEFHDVLIALSKARAMSWALEQLGESPPANNLACALKDAPDGAHDWLHSVVAEALRDALREAEAAFRKSATQAMRDEVLTGGGA